MTFAAMVAEELERARAKHRPIHSTHEGYAVILEELDEFWDEMRQQVPHGEKMLSELIQVAAMCQRAAEDTRLVEDFGPIVESWAALRRTP